ncbi:MAG: 4a-hydroxytetrahydrobiopterin dehydratase [Anaerolineae bacterium]|nr:4a-hydroxytetrahydrobiopterin dehydratase [Anaerolineae bacterium]
MRSLAELNCIPCRGGEPALSEREIKELHGLLPDWQVVERDGIRRLERGFKFRDFAQALVFTNQIGELAEAEDHHPALLTEWGRVTVTWWTHVIGGLHRNDFIIAARCDQMYS